MHPLKFVLKGEEENKNKQPVWWVGKRRGYEKSWERGGEYDQNMYGTHKKKQQKR